MKETTTLFLLCIWFSSVFYPRTLTFFLFASFSFSISSPSIHSFLLAWVFVPLNCYEGNWQDVWYQCIKVRHMTKKYGYTVQTSVMLDFLIIQWRFGGGPYIFSLGMKSKLPLHSSGIPYTCVLYSVTHEHATPIRLLKENTTTLKLMHPVLTIL